MSYYDEERSENENLCRALYAIADALRDLGFGADRNRGPGAFEGHTMMLRDEIAPAIATAIKDGLEQVAEAIASGK